MAVSPNYLENECLSSSIVLLINGIKDNDSIFLMKIFVIMQNVICDELLVYPSFSI